MDTESDVKTSPRHGNHHPRQPAPPGRHRVPAPVRHLPALACAIAALIALAVILRAGHPAQAYLVNSDAFYLPVLFDDLLARGGSLGDWYLTPAPYFFPDFPLYFLTWLGATGMFRQVTLFALLQVAGTGVALFLLARPALASGRLLAAALTVLFVWLGLHAYGPYVYLFSSAHHYGAFVAALLLLALWLGRDTSPSRPGSAMLALLVFLATLSDALFLVQAVVPLTAAAFLCRHGATPATGPRRALLLLVAPALAAMLSYRFLVAHPTRYKARLGFGRLQEHLGELAGIGDALFASRPLLAAALVLALFAGVACCAVLLRGRKIAVLPRPLVLLLVFATLSCAASIALMLLSTNVEAVPRYLIAALSWPLVAGLFALAHLFGRHFRYAGLGLAAVFAALLSVQAWQVRQVRDADRYFYPEQIACIDRALAGTNARHGIAQYWDAKLLQGLSRHQLTLAQYFGTLEPMQWITSQRFFGERYDFAIIAEDEGPAFRLPREQFSASGQVTQSVSCGNRTVLLFGSPGLHIGGAGAGVR